MTINRKRSLSPTAVERPALGGTLNYINPLKRFVGFFKGTKPVQSASVNIPPHTIEGNINEINANTDLSTNIVSEKRRRLSVQQNTMFREFKPRSSVDYTNLPSKYENYLSKLQEQAEDLNSDIERRATIIPDDISETDSPIPDIADVKRQSDVMIRSLENPDHQLQKYEPETEDTDSVETVSVIEEFAPLYTDEDGNLVRPPFISLAPKERYQLLQLKKSIEASKELQTKLKYTIDPNETHSIPISANKVETSTQTYDAHYLKHKLHFTDLKHQKRVKSTGGTIFSGEFMYDVEEPKPIEQNNNKFNGYLGNVTKPTFSKDTKEKRHFNHNGEITLDSDYVSKTEKISDLIKVKSGGAKESHLEPSTGFQFSINKDEMNDLINKRKVDNELIEKAEEAPKLVFDKADKKEAKEAPKFSFGAQEAVKDAPKFSFGAKEDKETPKFSFGAKEDKKEAEAPKFSFGAKEDKKEAEAPKFSFGAKDDKKEAEAPKFSFGAKEDKKEAPTFNFGSKDKVEAPKFSFGAKEDKKEAPSFNFGAKEDKKQTPTFNFGGKETKPSSTFNFGSKEDKKEVPKETPSFNFGAKDKIDTPKFSLVPKEAPKETPTFNFGAKPEQKQTPSFNFGATEKPKESPSFNFGATDKPALKFGGKDKETPATKTETPFKFGQDKSKPLFSNAPQTEEREESQRKRRVAVDNDKPSFNFGATSGPSTPGISSLTPGLNKEPKTFNFGQTEKPSFNFGSTEKPNFSFTPNPSRSAPPSAATFNFGQSKSVSPSYPNLTNAIPGSGPGSVPGTVPGSMGTIPGSVPGSMGTVPGSVNGMNMVPNGLPNNGFTMHNGITPIKPTGFAPPKENTPFSFTRSNTATPDFNFQAGAPMAPANSFTGTPMNGMNMNGMNGTPMNGGPMGSVPPLNRPNRKFAQMRRRRG